ncbi:hypothetical protein [Mucilaginibacter paludis]|uniref:Uncharacterized protein n=1 Tax=Mucilaginibacter paludis DSM 18603 TaxID=714943 RepID=H1YAA1_9SPHI|nr:hypothetical protein [Mucilaginibacter paludis]EHQ25982.1 hypothetical protein Mucpa_1829 [Mucilaginibacter paludis DSM 18603]
MLRVILKDTDAVPGSTTTRLQVREAGRGAAIAVARGLARMHRRE